MISFPKLKNKHAEANINERIEPSIRTRRRIEIDPETEPLTENPEVQKARHRLLGAVFLLLIAVIGLPRIFDSEPKKITNDVVLNLVSSVNDSASIKPIETKTPEPKPQETKEAETKPHLVEKSNPTISAPSSAPEIIHQLLADKKEQKDQGLDDSETVIEQSKPKVKESKVLKESKEAKEPKVPKASPSSIEDVITDAKVNDVSSTKQKFYIQIATFSSNERVKKMAAKLKALKISSYTLERRRESDDSTLYQLRAGPFSSKEEAQAIVKKMSDLDIDPKILEMK
jgi:DedD protein